MKPYEVFYLSENGVITADSIPDLDDWGFDEWWGCSDWVAWHKANKQKYGTAVANQKFAEYWNKQTMGSGALDCRTFNTDFRNYVAANDLSDIVYESAGLFGLLLKPIGAGSDVVTGVSRGVSTGAKIMRVLIPAALIGGAIYGGAKIYQAVKKK